MNSKGSAYADPVTGKMPHRSTVRRLAAVTVAVGSLLLIAAILAPWYSYRYARVGGPSVNSETWNETFYLDPPWGTSAVRYSCSGSAACAAQNSYADASLNSTALVVEICFFLVAMGATLGLIAGLWGVMFRGSPLRSSPHLVLSGVATLFGVSAAVYFALALPGAFSSDMPGQGSFYPGGPWASFSGSLTYDTSIFTPFTTTYTLSWGPLAGWYLVVTATLVLFVGVFLLYRYRRDSDARAPVSAAGPTELPPAVEPSTRTR